MTTDEMIRKGVAEAVAASVLGALDGGARDALLSKAVRDSLDGWELQSAVRKLIEGRAQAVAAAEIEKGSYDQLILDAVHAGAENLLQSLPDAVTKTLKEALFGAKNKDGYGGASGLTLKFLETKGG